MSPTNSDALLEEVLLAFSVEPARDRATVERYLKLYPQYAEDLIDLLSEARIPERQTTNIAEDEAVFQRAWREFTGTAPGRDAPGHFANPFTHFHGLGFAQLAQSLRIPRSVLIALRDHLVIASSIPAPFLSRLIRLTRSTEQELLAYLEQPPVVAHAASYKSDEKPEALEKVNFEQLLDNSGIPADQKRDICMSPD